MEKRSVLGKGLSALIPENVETGGRPDKDHKVSMVAVSDICENTLQPRMHYAEDALEELKASIKDKGILQPILVRPRGDTYEVVAGERRFRAARELGMESVPVLIREVTDNEALVLALVENIQREELNPIEEAKAFVRLSQDFAMTQEQIAEAVGKERPTVSNIMRLLKLPKMIQDALEQGILSMGHARSLLSIEDEQKQYQVFLKIVEDGVSVRRAEEMIKTTAGETRRKKTKPEKDHEIIRLEEELRGILGTKVSIEAKQKRGKIVIEYYSFDDLDRILDILRK